MKKLCRLRGRPSIVGELAYLCFSLTNSKLVRALSLALPLTHRSPPRPPGRSPPQPPVPLTVQRVDEEARQRGCSHTVGDGGVGAVIRVGGEHGEHGLPRRGVFWKRHLVALLAEMRRVVVDVGDEHLQSRPHRVVPVRHLCRVQHKVVVGSVGGGCSLCCAG